MAKNQRSLSSNSSSDIAKAVAQVLQAGVQPKRSGCTTKISTKNSKRVTFGWKLIDGTMYHYFAGLIRSEGKLSKSGHRWQGCVVQITNTRSGEISKVGGAMIVESKESGKVGKVIFGNMVMNPHAPNKGYTGRFGK